MLILAGSTEDIASNPNWNTGCIECAECVILDLFSNSEFEIGEFCGDALTDVEHPSYAHYLSEILISMSGNDTLQPGYYGANNDDLYEIHCPHHDHH